MSNRIIILTDEYNIFGDFICDIHGSIVFRLWFKHPHLAIIFHGFTRNVIKVIQRDPFFIWDDIIEFLKNTKL